MISGLEYRYNLAKCPERSDSWLSASSDEDDSCEPCEDSQGPSEQDDDELAYQEFLDEFSKK